MTPPPRAPSPGMEKLKDLLRCVSALAYVLRALGFEMINSLMRKWKDPEPPKPALRKSFWISLSRSSIHFTPMTVLAVLIYVNYRTIYIGPGFTSTKDDTVYLALFQVAAKIQELMCVASMSTVVLQALRHELLGDGVPIGLLGSGVWFSQVSSFWSPEFLAAAPYSTKGIKNFRLYVLLILSGGIAALIGPAAAVLMLPRVQNVPAGGTNYFLNGTVKQFWPSIVTSGSELDVCSLINSTKYAVCPSGGYESLRLTLNNFNYSNFYAKSGAVYTPQIQVKGSMENYIWSTFLIQSPQSLVPPVISSSQIRGKNDYTVVIQPHAATVILQQQLIRDWYNAAATYPTTIGSSLSEYKWARHLITSGTTTSPWVRVRCTTAQNLSAEADQAGFPYLYQRDGFTLWADDFRMLNISEFNRNESSRLRTQWTPLPMYNFGVIPVDIVTSGLLLELPWTRGSRLAVGCAVAAAWHNGTVSSDTASNYNAWSNDFSDETWGPQRDSPDADHSNQPVTLDKSWLDLLTPANPGESSDNGSWIPNTLEKIFFDSAYADIISDLGTRPQPIELNDVCAYGVTNSSMTDTELWNDFSCGKASKMGHIEFIIASMVADGLSRYGSSRVYNVLPLLQDWTLKKLPRTPDFNRSLLLGREAISVPSDPNLVVQCLVVKVVGYAYYASTTTDYLATFIACAYLLLAGGHVIWILWHRVSSSCWDTITELLVLCHNSPQSAALKNTSPGIQRLATYTTVAKIRAAPPADQRVEPRLLLVIEDGTCKPGDTDRGTDGRALNIIESGKKYC